jgi:hypothetical protein
MAEDTPRQIVDAMVGVKQRTIGGARYGVDRQVATRQVLGQADFGSSAKGKSPVARPGLALGARQRILLVGGRVQEDRKVLADGPEASGQHLFGGRPDDHVVTILDRQAEQFVANRPTDGKDLHRGAWELAAARTFAQRPAR